MAARAPWMERPTLLGQLAKSVLLIALAVVMLFPLVYVLAVSFSSYEDVVGGGITLWPRNPTLDAYRAVLSGGIVVRSLLVTAGLALGGTAVNMLLTVSFAYGLSRPSVPGSRAILLLVLFSMLFSPGLIPNYLLVKQLGLIDSYWALILPGAIGAFNLIIMRNFIMGLPQELLESARIDGASDLQILLRLVLPLSKAVLAVIALFYAVGHWNTFFSAVLYINDTSMWPIQVVLRQYVLQGASLAGVIEMDPNQLPPPPQTLQMAVIVIATVPILVVYPLLQKYFTKGVLSGAIKG